MNQLQNTKIVQLIADMTVDNAAFTTAEIDAQGYDHVTIIASFGNVPANVASMTVTESDTTGSGHSAFVTYGTTADIAGATTSLPAASGGDGKTHVIEIDMRGRKRFLDFTCTAGDGSGTVTELSAIAILSRGDVGPQTAAERGAAHVVRV